MGNYLGFDIGVAVLSTYDDDDFPGVQIDAFGEQNSGVQDYELHSPHGFLSIPLDPDVDDEGLPIDGCQALYALEGGKGHIWLSHDPRLIPGLPRLQKGESMVYAKGWQFLRLKDDGSLTLFTTADNLADGPSVYFQVAPDGFRFVAPWGTMKFDATGFHILHSSGARMDLGGIGGIPLFSSYFSVQSAVANVGSSVVAMGPDGPALPLASGQPLVALLTALINIVSTITVGPGAPVGVAATALLSQLPGVLATTATHS